MGADLQRADVRVARLSVDAPSSGRSGEDATRGGGGTFDSARHGGSQSQTQPRPDDDARTEEDTAPVRSPDGRGRVRIVL
jgi:hypothetical protein